MFMQFKCKSFRKYAIRSFFGGVNGISRQSFTDDRHCDNPESESDSLEQDYVVVPSQKRLDGVAISPGVVKQFVAAKLTSQSKQEAMSRSTSKPQNQSSDPHVRQPTEAFQPIGETIEWQMTGKDSIGGIQLQIIPQFNVGNMYAGSMRDVSPVARQLQSYEPLDETPIKYDVLKSPGELGLSEGDTIHVKNMLQQKQGARPKLIRDLVVEAPGNLTEVDVELEICYEPVHAKIFNVRDTCFTGSAVHFKVFVC
jgi:hypothetical protein